MIKLGIVGAGRLGSFHADKAAAHPDIDLVAVMDPVESSRKTLAKKHHIADCATLDELFPLVDAVVLAAPTSAHYEMGVQCLRRGLHLLMEKPMCASWNEAELLVDAAKKSNVVFQVGHVEEFNPAWRAAKPLLDEIKSGKPAMIDAVRTSGYSFRSTDIGTVFDMMIHDIDLVLSVVPAKVLSVDASGFNMIGGPFEDIANARLRFENGTIANLFSSRVAQQAVRTMRITARDATATIDFGTRTTTFYRPNRDVLDKTYAPSNVSFGKAAALAPSFMREHFSTEEIGNDVVDALSLEMNDFVRAIQTDSKPTVSGERALASIAIAEMICSSIEKGIPLSFGHVAPRKVA